MPFEIELTQLAREHLKAIRVFDRARIVGHDQAATDVSTGPGDTQPQTPGEYLALLVGVGDKDEEQLELEASPEFWQMIRESRKTPTVKLKDVETELLSGE